MAKIETPVTAESFIYDGHVKRSRYACQVSAASLSLLLQQAWNAYDKEGDLLSFPEWVSLRCSASAQFKHWYTFLELELLLLLFMRSIREGAFGMFVDALQQMAPWAFALDHVHYARWMSIFIQSLLGLPIKHPDI